MATKYVDLERLTYYNSKIKETYATKDEIGKVSIATVDDAGIVKPDGTTITIDLEGTITAATPADMATKTELKGYATKAELPAIATTETAGIVKPDGTSIKVDELGTLSATPTDLTAYAKKTEIPTIATEDVAGIVKPDGTSITVTAEGVISTNLPDLEGYVQDADIADMLTQTQAAEEYAKKEEAATKAELADYAKSSQVATDIQSAKTELEGTINSKIGSAYKSKGSTTFAELPTPSADTLGDVYNVTDAFVTDENFLVESQSYPAGTNVVVADAGEETYKYDPLTGLVDTSAFMLKTDITAVTNEDIDGLFSAEPSS